VVCVLENPNYTKAAVWTPEESGFQGSRRRLALEQSEFQRSRGLALGESEFRLNRFKNLNFDENFGVPKSYCLG
jgi:hypothetical protein